MNRIWVRFYQFLLFVILTIGIAPVGRALPMFSDGSDQKYTEQQARLIYAIRDHDFNTVQRLLQEGLNANFLYRESPEDELTTPLIESIAVRQPHIFALLFEFGAEANFGENVGAVALTSAAWYDDLEMTRELLRRGASVEARDQEGFTALLTVADRSRDLAVIKLLLAAGANPKARSSKSGLTTVMIAAANLNLDAVELFIDLGVDPCARDNRGETAMDASNTPIIRANEKGKLKERVAIQELLRNKCATTAH